jgi:hypothetical protein
VAVAQWRHDFYGVGAQRVAPGVISANNGTPITNVNMKVHTTFRNGKDGMNTVVLLLVWGGFAALLVRRKRDGRAKPNGME